MSVESMTSVCIPNSATGLIARDVCHIVRSPQQAEESINWIHAYRHSLKLRKGLLIMVSRLDEVTGNLIKEIVGRLKSYQLRRLPFQLSRQYHSSEALP